MNNKVTIFCMSGEKPVKHHFENLDSLGWGKGNINSGYLLELIDKPIRANGFTTDEKYIYMSVDRFSPEECSELDSESVEQVDVFFNGSNIISFLGWVNKDTRTISSSDFNGWITEYHFNQNMWDKIVIKQTEIV